MHSDTFRMLLAEQGCINMDWFATAGEPFANVDWFATKLEGAIAKNHTSTALLSPIFLCCFWIC